MFCEESLGKINKCDLELFRNGSVREFYRLKEFYYNFCLKELITLEQVNTSVLLAKTNRSAVVNFSPMQMNLF